VVVKACCACFRNTWDNVSIPYKWIYNQKIIFCCRGWGCCRWPPRKIAIYWKLNKRFISLSCPDATTVPLGSWDESCGPSKSIRWARFYKSSRNCQDLIHQPLLITAKLTDKIYNQKLDLDYNPLRPTTCQTHDKQNTREG